MLGLAYALLFAVCLNLNLDSWNTLTWYWICLYAIGWYKSRKSDINFGFFDQAGPKTQFTSLNLSYLNCSLVHIFHQYKNKDLYQCNCHIQNSYSLPRKKLEINSKKLAIKCSKFSITNYAHSCFCSPVLLLNIHPYSFSKLEYCFCCWI